MTNAVRERFDELLATARSDFERGEFETAIAHARSAEALARDHGELELADRALCSRCGYEIQDTGTGEQIAALKQVLLRSRDPENRFLAAYYTAVGYDLTDDTARAYSYASRAQELASELDDPKWLAGAANLAGNLAARESNIAEAEIHFRDAFDNHPAGESFERIMRAQIEDNIGYVLMCTGRLTEGITLAESARQSLESLRAEHYLHTVLQDLCYGYLLDERYDLARQCGERALELAIEQGDELIAKNCLFLLSETSVRQGDSFRARRYLRELATHYPDVGISEEIVDVFLSTDLTTVVNLRG
jgi:tetratricopeptide (TPR) repeat protein